MFTADRYTVDGVTGKVAALVDHLDATHLAVQATSANQVAIPTADSTMRGAKSLDFAGGQYYVSNRAASAFKYLHTAYWAVAVLVPTGTAERIVCSTIRSGATTQIGSFFARSSIEFKVRSYDGSGVANNANVSVTQNSSTLYSMVVDYIEAASPEWRMRQNGSSAGTGNSTRAPSSSDPESTLYIGAYNNAASPLQGRLAFLALKQITAPPTAAELSVVSSYLQTKYGVS